MKKTFQIPLIVSCIALSACSARMGELEAYIDEVKSRKSTEVDPVPTPKIFEPVEYEVAERRSPFEQPRPNDEEIIIGEGGSDLLDNSGPRPIAGRNKEPLEEFTIDSLNMLGTLSIRNDLYALICAPDSVAHRVAVGNYLGQNHGEITAISETGIEVRQLISDGFGSWLEDNTQLVLDDTSDGRSSGKSCNPGKTRK